MRTTRVLIAATLLVTASMLAARQLGRFLVVADPLPDHADAVVMLSGSPADRVLETARLYRAGLAPLVVLTRERLPRGAPALRAGGVRLPEEHDLARQALVELGVPDDAIRVLGRRTTSTKTEAQTVARWACRDGVRRLVVVTSPSHTRRARLILGLALGPRVAVAVRPAPDAVFPATRWWRRRRALKEVLWEYQKLAAFWTVERWGMRPCGGLERRATAGRAQCCSAALRTSGASSPLACSSRTMSQPPTNSPPTKTCGMVGQFV
jgi:uncharacterized SAM-binding protein YcdF (DUF218 family)